MPKIEKINKKPNQRLMYEFSRQFYLVANEYSNQSYYSAYSSLRLLMLQMFVIEKSVADRSQCTCFMCFEKLLFLVRKRKNEMRRPLITTYICWNICEEPSWFIAVIHKITYSKCFQLSMISIYLRVRIWFGFYVQFSADG